ncbi:MAG: bifunctional phosphopantothenoylcysteine decarboxylase/phosphopantothenate--cysteine ligase CoaBC [Nitrospirae bacterium CG_4_9_14_3_um_filter_51_5]|nr:MAG: bifunctional phosphopantothenoylcysteine decarboxylase/phosphopantothenate--cysteine ligase CoaBC [Nitrospirae bacterium CG_4_9_14_3_um_filter_51_5]
MSTVLARKRIILGVTGSIAAYKAVGLLRSLTTAGASVHVVMTDAAIRFIAPLTFEVLSGHPVASDVFAGHQDMKHLSLTEQADLLVVAPCTANTLAKLALGLADNLLGTLALTVQCPVMICPAMDGEMWAHPAVQAHAQTLRQRGVVMVEPEVGVLASGEWGQGRLATEEAIMSTAVDLLHSRTDWQGERVLISAGPTQEPIDPVRFISNGSSGKMGYALAEAAVKRGAEVVLVTGPTQLVAPKNVTVIPVITAEDMLQALTARFEWATTLMMTAAVGDFRPKQAHVQKVKKDQWHGEGLDLERTPDILMALSAQRTHQRLVGFAAETDHLIEHGQAKLASKHLDMLIVNHIGGEQSAFGNDTNEVYVLTPNAAPHHIPRMPKRQLADTLLDRMASLPVQPSRQKAVVSPTS